MKLKFTQTVDNRVTKDNIYKVIDSSMVASTNIYHFYDNNNNLATIFKWSCNGEYAVIVHDELNRNIKVI